MLNESANDRHVVVIIRPTNPTPLLFLAVIQPECTNLPTSVRGESERRVACARESTPQRVDPAIVRVALLWTVSIDKGPFIDVKGDVASTSFLLEPRKNVVKKICVATSKRVIIPVRRCGCGC